MSTQNDPSTINEMEQAKYMARLGVGFIVAFALLMTYAMAYHLILGIVICGAMVCISLIFTAVCQHKHNQLHRG